MKMVWHYYVAVDFVVVFVLLIVEPFEHWGDRFLVCENVFPSMDCECDEVYLIWGED